MILQKQGTKELWDESVKLSMTVEMQKRSGRKSNKEKLDC